MGTDEVGTLNALKEHRRERIDPTIARHNGRIVKATGDGLLVEFASVVDAVGCAVAIQRAMLAFNVGIHTDRQIVLRIGINVGDIIIDGGDIFGDGVNVAARLEALCEPGGVCISRSANEQVRDKLPFIQDVMVRDVNAAWERAQAMGVPVAQPIGDRSYGLRDFTVIDPDGFGVRFGVECRRRHDYARNRFVAPREITNYVFEIVDPAQHWNIPDGLPPIGDELVSCTGRSSPILARWSARSRSPFAASSSRPPAFCSSPDRCSG